MATPAPSYQPKPIVGPISGFTNFNEAQHYVYAQWLERIAGVFALYGFTPLIPRPVELRDNLHVKGGMAKQIYSIARTNEDGSLADDGRPAVIGTDIGLPFDRTVPLALWVAQYANEMTLPYKRYDIGWVFRGETAQAGRFRGFHQADVDIIGRQLGVTADVECMMAIAQALVALNIGEITMHINHIAIAKGLLRKAGVTTEQEPHVLRIIDKLEKVGAAVLKPEILAAAPQLTAEIVDQLMAVYTFRGDCVGFKNILEQAAEGDAEILAGYKHLCALEAMFNMVNDPLFHPGGASFDELRRSGGEFNVEGLKTAHGEPVEPRSVRSGKAVFVKLVVNPGLVRGLDYYTGVVVESFLTGFEKFGSIASGGRYSNLVASFSDKHPDIEGVGFSIGVTRLFDVLCRANAIKLERKTTADVLIAYRSEALQQAFAAATFLRGHGVNVDMYANPARPMKHQLEYASKKGMPLVLMLMSTEGQATVDAYVLKNLANREQVEWKNQAACFGELLAKLG